jgi:hypothetical protein
MRKMGRVEYERLRWDEYRVEKRGEWKSEKERREE